MRARLSGAGVQVQQRRGPCLGQPAGACRTLPAAALAAAPAPGSQHGPAPPRGAPTIGLSSCQSQGRARCSPRPRPGPMPGAVLRRPEEARGGLSVRTGPRGARQGGAGVQPLSGFCGAVSGHLLGQRCPWKGLSDSS